MKRILVDTNLILRYLLDGDDFLPKLAKENLIWLPNEVIFETIFTLISFYKLDRIEVFDLMCELLMKPNIDSERVVIISVLAIFRDNKNLSLIDSFLTNLANTKKIDLVTYDKALTKKSAR